MLCREDEEKKLSQAGSFDRHLEASLLSSYAFPYIPGVQSVPLLSLLKTQWVSQLPHPSRCFFDLSVLA